MLAALRCILPIEYQMSASFALNASVVNMFTKMSSRHKEQKVIDNIHYKASPSFQTHALHSMIGSI